MLNGLGRVGMESATCPSLVLTSCVTTPLVYVSTGADETEIEAVLMRHLKREREDIPVSRNVNWNNRYKVVAQCCVRRGNSRSNRLLLGRDFDSFVFEIKCWCQWRQTQKALKL